MLKISIKSNLLLSKKNLLNVFFLKKLQVHSLQRNERHSNNFVSLKSPFHYKLVKNTLGIPTLVLNVILITSQPIKLTSFTRLFGTIEQFTNSSTNLLKL